MSRDRDPPWLTSVAEPLISRPPFSGLEHLRGYIRRMSQNEQRVTIYHNPSCSSSKSAVNIADELGVHPDIVLYLTTPPDAEALRGIIAKLEDPVTDLVRRDATWDKLGLTDADAATADQVVELLVQHKQLLQRPIVIKGDRAIIGRPKDRVRELLG
jgi:arsenate reductase (glutaredoxin)